MAKGRHRRRDRALVLLVTALFLLGVSGCGKPGHVIDKIYRETAHPRYLLKVQEAAGAVRSVGVTRLEYERCNIGERYPDCKKPTVNPPLQEV